MLRREENWSTRRKTSRIKDENQQQTQPTYAAESENRSTDGRRVLSPLRHPCSPKPELLKPQTKTNKETVVREIRKSREIFYNKLQKVQCLFPKGEMLKYFTCNIFTVCMKLLIIFTTTNCKITNDQQSFLCLMKG